MSTMKEILPELNSDTKSLIDDKRPLKTGEKLYRNEGCPTGRQTTSRRWWTTGYDYLDIFYFPYTLMFLGFFIIGCMFAPKQNWETTIIGSIIMLLAVGFSAHYFDELAGRPLGTNIPTQVLWTGAVASLTLSGLFMVFLGLKYDLIIIGIFLVSAFLLIAYNLELFQGKLHGDLIFVIDYGLVPQIIGYYFNCFEIPPISLFIAMCGIMCAAGVETIVNHFIKDHSNYRTEYSPQFAYLQRAVWFSLVAVYLTAIGLLLWRLGY